jgi:hypothetical protein
MSSFDLDTSRIKSTLNRLQNRKQRSSNLWKPSEGEQKIRIVPNKYQKNFPFVELKFHYNLPGKNYVSPASEPIGKKDPIVEFCKELRRVGGKEKYEIANDIEPKPRTFAPVLVRGEESEGVRYWGFGKTIYRELLTYLDDPDYGNFIDPTEGMDIKVKYTPRDQSPTKFPQTDIMILPNRSPITNDPDKVDELIENQVHITDVFDVPEYDELKRILEDYRDAGFDKEKYQSQAVDFPGSDSSSSDENTSSEDSSEDSSDEESGSVMSEESSDIDELEEEFDSMFGE